MNNAIQKFIGVWKEDPNRGIIGTERNISFDDIVNSIVSTGPFYCYIVDFANNYALSHVSASIENIIGLHSEKATFASILENIHPEDLDWVAKAEAFGGQFYNKTVETNQLLKYKTSFNFRLQTKSGEYALFNHQALMLVLGPDGGFGKALNIHTRIDHLTNQNTYRFSLIGIDGEPSYLNIPVEENFPMSSSLTRKEIEIIKLIASGKNTNEIAKLLFISPLTVKKHRANILTKTDCHNMAQLIKNSLLQGLI